MTSTQPATGFKDVQRLLQARGLEHAVVEHEQTFTAVADMVAEERDRVGRPSAR